ncbi:MAG: branched-chain amino acid ABC transporter permease [Propionibacteriaceae bacterium]|jgi:branched-chain amino acid transport system permease protein|nr:branched-chain amino acid ABC transporter permease [Propionibacteriaceae bacterium]
MNENLLRPVAIAGAGLGIASIFLPWAYGPRILDDMTYYFGPSFLQVCYALLAVVALACLVAHFFLDRMSWFARVIAWNDAAKAASLGAVGYAIAVIIAIAVGGGGLINVEPGGWLALGGGALAAVSWFLPASKAPIFERLRCPKWVQILAIAAVMAVLLFAAAFALNQSEADGFLVFAVFLGAAIFTFHATGFFGWLSLAAANNRKVLVISAFTVAFAFPFTQNGSDANMSVAAQVLTFAATAIGLNIVVGLVGLLDLGYIAFLGAGAFTAAVMSKSVFATLSVDLPFPVVALISGTVAALFGLLIGTPTLRVSGDYLAIVTLAFGEIFRITMINLDGTDGPNITHGSNGVPSIPNLDFFGFDFGQSHEIFGIQIGRFSNYYWLLLLVIGLIILVFANLNHSRIGRGWVAIREDEMAAESMGVNTFGLKLLAFAGGAFLAGVAGSVKAYTDTSVSPDQYVFLESAFLLAAVVLGGMGTIMGVLIGATLLKLLPEKLRYFEDYRLLLFGALMVVMMRFRPEGIIADERRQLEFHDTDEELAEEVEEDLTTHHAHLNADKELP